MMIINGIGVRLDLVWNRKKAIQLLVGQMSDTNCFSKFGFILSIQHKLMIWHNKETQTHSSTSHKLRNKE